MMRWKTSLSFLHQSTCCEKYNEIFIMSKSNHHVKWVAKVQTMFNIMQQCLRGVDFIWHDATLLRGYWLALHVIPGVIYVAFVACFPPPPTNTKWKKGQRFSTWVSSNEVRRLKTASRFPWPITTTRFLVIS